LWVGVLPRTSLNKSVMYWIEIDFANGKTVRKESESLNDSFAMYNRYCCSATKRKQQIQRIRAGYDDKQTFVGDHIKYVRI